MELWESVAALPVPVTAVLGGARDRTVLDPLAERYREAGANVIVLDGSGHDLWEPDLKRFVALLRDQADRTPSGGSSDEGWDSTGRAYGLRDAADADFEFVHALRSEAFRRHVIATYGTWNDAEQRQRLAAHWHDRPWQILEVEGSAVGVLSVREEQEPVELDVIVLDPAVRGRGIGSAVIRDVVRRAAASGRGVALQVLRTNERARRLYERLGFTVTDETATNHVMKLREPPPPR